MANIKNALRVAAPAAQIETVSLADIAAEINPVDVRLSHHNESGNDYLHFVTAEGSYLSVKIGNKVDTENKTGAELIKSVLKNNVIYTGTSENGQWFTFGPIPELRPTVSVSFASLMKEGLVKLAAK